MRWSDLYSQTPKQARARQHPCLDVLDRDTTVNVLAGALADGANDVARFDQHIIQFADHAFPPVTEPHRGKRCSTRSPEEIRAG